jgi:hypothetical protein
VFFVVKIFYLNRPNIRKVNEYVKICITVYISSIPFLLISSQGIVAKEAYRIQDRGCVVSDGTAHG